MQNTKFQFQLDRSINSDNWSFEKNLLPGGCAKLAVFKSNSSNLSNDKKNIVIKKLKLKHPDSLVMNSLEFTMGRLVDHPSILQAFDIDITNMCLAIDYFPSQELTEYVELTRQDKHSDLPRLKLSSILDIQRQLLDVLVHFNERGLAHLDIKHENILVKHYKAHEIIDTTNNTNSNTDTNTKINNQNTLGSNVYFDEYKYEIKVIDLAMVRSNTPTKEVLGTPEMYSLDQIQQKTYIPELIDSWCWGMILYSLLYGAHLWDITTIQKFYSTRIDYLIKESNTKFTFPHDPSDVKLLTDQFNLIFVNTLTQRQSKRLSIQELHYQFNEIIIVMGLGCL